MLDARFINWKLNYTKIKDLAAGAFVSSEEITAGGQVWRFRCYPRGSTKELAPKHLSIFLDLVSKVENVRAIFEAFMMHKNGKPSLSHARRRLEVFPANNLTTWGWYQFVKGSDLKSLYMTDGFVTITCGVIVVCDDDPLINVPPSDMGNHLGCLLDCADGSDVSFIVNGETFPAHRAVLAARSPVFKAQLLGSMADAKMPSITMHDIAPVAFKAMLRYMYTDALPADDTELGASSTEVFQDLLVLADRYGIDRLKLMCATKLWENVSTETVGAILVCAETYNCPELKNKCIGFVAKEENLKKTVLTDGFLQLVQKFPSIVAAMREKLGIEA